MNLCSEWCLTTGILVAGIVLVIWTAWREHRWHKSSNIPLLPTTPFMFIGALVTLMALAHLLTLAGISRPAGP